MVLVLLFLTGLFVGSFLNVLIYRIPRGQQFVAGRSRCPHCRAVLAWYDLIPVASWLILHGRCRTCHQQISPVYPFVELLSGLFFVFAPSIPMLVALEVFLVLVIVDYRHLIIPDGLLIVLLAAALATRAFSWDTLWTVLGCGGFFLLLWLVSRGRWIGFGDVKFAAVIGVLFGFPGGVIALYAAVILGGVISVFLLALGRATMKTKLPLGSLFAVSAMWYILFRI